MTAPDPRAGLSDEQLTGVAGWADEDVSRVVALLELGMSWVVARRICALVLLEGFQVDERLRIVESLWDAGISEQHVSLMATHRHLERAMRLMDAGVSADAIDALADAAMLEPAERVVAHGVPADVLSTAAGSPGVLRTLLLPPIADLLDEGMPVPMAEQVLVLQMRPDPLRQMRRAGLTWADVAAVLTMVRRRPDGWPSLSPSTPDLLASFDPEVRRYAVASALTLSGDLSLALPRAVRAAGTSWGETFLALAAEMPDRLPYQVMLSARALDDAGPGFDMTPVEPGMWWTPRPLADLPRRSPADTETVLASLRGGPIFDALGYGVVVALDGILRFDVDPRAAIDMVDEFAGAPTGTEAPLGASFPSAAAITTWMAATVRAGRTPDDIRAMWELPVPDGTRSVLLGDAFVAAACGVSLDTVRQLVDAGVSNVGSAALLLDAGFTRETVVSLMHAGLGWAALSLVDCGIPLERVEELLPTVTADVDGVLVHPLHPIGLQVRELLLAYGLTVADCVSSVRSTEPPLADPALPVHVLDLALGLLARTQPVARRPHHPMNLSLEDALLLAVTFADLPDARLVVDAIPLHATAADMSAVLTRELSARRSAASRVRLSPRRDASAVEVSR